MARPLLIDRASILGIGLLIANEEGLDAVTMHAVARALGVTPMALYRHVANKADLLDGLVHMFYEDLPLPPTDMPWSERLGWIGEAVRGAVLRNPGVAGLLLGSTPHALASRPLRDWIQRCLRDAGVARNEAPDVERVITTALLGAAVREAAWRHVPQGQGEADRAFAATLRMIALYVDDLRTP
ncbi:MAG: TetR/AcrR family transcriptional regulator [Acidimicrobiales bacterium]